MGAGHSVLKPSAGKVASACQFVPMRLLLALVVLVTVSSLKYGKMVRNKYTASQTRLSVSTVPPMSDVSSQMADLRAAMAKDEKTALMMDALRGKNINDDDKQGDNIDMLVVETRSGADDNDVLPTVYSPEALSAYFRARPGAVFQRIYQILTTSSGFLAAVISDALYASITNMSEEERGNQEVRRAAALRSTIVSLGPFFIKLGQALSIRPDILSPRAMVELQQLCDKVPSFDSDLAMKTIEQELKDSVMCQIDFDTETGELVEDCVTEGVQLLGGSGTPTPDRFFPEDVEAMQGEGEKKFTVRTISSSGGMTTTTIRPSDSDKMSTGLDDSMDTVTLTENAASSDNPYVNNKNMENPVVRSIFSEISPEPVAAASLGQVYKAKLRATGEEVAVKVQRPFVLETVSLDLFLVRSFGDLARKFFPAFTARLDVISLLDEFASNFYAELDYNLECENGLRIAEDMKRLPQVKIPKNYPEYTSRRIHCAEWVEGEKLSQSTAGDVGSLVNLGVITYLTQLLDTGFFHADPHPGNMLRTPDGQLVILDFGLMTKITDDQKYGMIEAIAHLIHRDYEQIGQDFVNLDFIPPDVDTKPIIPALARVFDAALAGGGAKSINFQELAADLAEITFKFPFKIPPYFALVIRAISVLEGIALVGNPAFAIVDEAYPFISKRLLTAPNPRLKAAFKYMIYGKKERVDVDRLIDMLTALEKFVAIKDYADGTAFKVDGKRGGVDVGRAGDARGTRSVDDVKYAGTGSNAVQQSEDNTPSISTSIGFDINNAPISQQQQPQHYNNNKKKGVESEQVIAREALRFFFSEEGLLFREILLEEISTGIDALSRDAVRELAVRLITVLPDSILSSGVAGAFGRGRGTGNARGSILRTPVVSFFKTLAPKLSEEERQVVDNIVKLATFLVNQKGGSEEVSVGEVLMYGGSTDKAKNNNVPTNLISILQDLSTNEKTRQRLSGLAPLLQEYSPSIRSYVRVIVNKLVDKVAGRVIDATSKAIFSPV